MRHRLSLLFVVASQSLHAQFAFDSFLTVPGTPQAINSAGDVTGFSGSTSFIRKSDGSVTTFSYPGAFFTSAYGINSAGVVVGSYTDPSNAMHGFIRQSNGTISTFDVPGSFSTVINGVNDSGEMVGSSVAGAFYRSPAGVVKALQAGTLALKAAQAINNFGQILATNDAGNILVLNSNNQVIATIASPCAINLTDYVLLPRAITSAAQIAGTCASRLALMYANSSGFIRQPAGNVATIHIPISGSDWPQYPVTGMNDNGVFTGAIPADNGQPLGYISQTCTVTPLQTSRMQTSNTESSFVDVNAALNCGYLVKNAPDWIQVSAKAFTGSNRITYSVSANYTRSPRSATLRIGGQPVTITQQPSTIADCSAAILLHGVPVTTVNESYPGGTVGGVTAAVAPGCTWSAASDTSWISINGAVAKTGPGSIEITVAKNSTAAGRIGHVTVGAASLTIVQDSSPAACLYFGEKRVHLAAQGGSGLWSFSAPNCSGLIAVSDQTWLGLTGSAASGLIGYSAIANSTSVTRYANVSVLSGGTEIGTLRVEQPGPNQQTGLRFKAVTPCRIADTRNRPNGVFAGPTMTAGTSRDFPVPQSPCGIPANALAFSVNITVVPTESLGYLTIWPTGQTRPFVSTLNSLDGSIVANSAIVPAGLQGALSVFVSNTTDVILDINGYFVSANDTDALAFYPITPCRAVDTRYPTGTFGGPSNPVGGSSRSFPLRSTCGLPPAARVFALNVTVVPTGALAYLTIWPSDQSQPLVSTLNAPAGRIAANAAIVPASASGAVSVFTQYVGGGGDVIIDVTGYFAPPNAPDPLSLYPVSPYRALDTRDNPAPPAAGSTETTVYLPSRYPEYAAVVANITAVPLGPLPYLQVYPVNTPQPNVSTLNSADGRIVSNAVIIPLSGMSFKVFTFTGGAPSNFIVDVNGYFSP